MAKSSTKSNGISGLSIAGAFVGLGLVYAYWLTNVFGPAHGFITAAALLIGFTAFMLELQKVVNPSRFNFRFENAGIGLLVGVPTVWLLNLAYAHWHGWMLILAVIALSFLLILAFAGTIDFFVSVAESVPKQGKGFATQFKSLLQILTLLATTAGVVFTTLKQLGVDLW